MNITIGEYKGYVSKTFEVGGRHSIVIEPKVAAEGRPWIWRTEFLGAFDIIDLALVERGWHLCYHRVSNMYGCPQSLAWMREFQQVVEAEFDLSPLPVLFGFSRGGLYAVNYAKTYPDKVGMLYLDAPVLDIRDWPISFSEKEANECMDWYHLTPETLDDFRGCPIDYAPDIAKSGIPVLIIAGDADHVVHYDLNTCVFEKRYYEAGGKNLVVAVKTHCDHHPHSAIDSADFGVTVIEGRRRK